MIAWATIKPIISAQVARIAELPETSVRWVDEPSGLVNGVFPIVWLRVSSVVSVGMDEERYQYSGNMFDGNLVNMTGPRQFTLSIRAESFTNDIADDRHAGNIIERIKVRIRRSSSLQERNGSFGIAEHLGTKWISYIEAGRPINAYVCDFLCNTVDNDTDTTEGASDWIREAIVDGTVKDTTGATLGTVHVDADAK